MDRIRAQVEAHHESILEIRASNSAFHGKVFERFDQITSTLSEVKQALDRIERVENYVKSHQRALFGEGATGVGIQTRLALIEKHVAAMQKLYWLLVSASVTGLVAAVWTIIRYSTNERG